MLSLMPSSSASSASSTACCPGPPLDLGQADRPAGDITSAATGTARLQNESIAEELLI